MNIRAAHAGDIEQCERLDGSYVTNYVWQMDEELTAGAMRFTFRLIHTPRTIHVPYPYPLGNLKLDWRRKECFLVAQERGSVAGFLDMTVQRDGWRGVVQHLYRQGQNRVLLEVLQALAVGDNAPAHQVLPFDPGERDRRALARSSGLHIPAVGL